MIVAGASSALIQAGWVFWALGPQLVLCLVLASLTARKRHGDLLDWLVAGFAAALVPVIGAVVMVVLWRRAVPGTPVDASR